MDTLSDTEQCRTPPDSSKLFDFSDLGYGTRLAERLTRSEPWTESYPPNNADADACC